MLSMDNNAVPAVQRRLTLLATYNLPVSSSPFATAVVLNDDIQVMMWINKQKIGYITFVHV